MKKFKCLFLLLLLVPIPVLALDISYDTDYGIFSTRPSGIIAISDNLKIWKIRDKIAYSISPDKGLYNLNYYYSNPNLLKKIPKDTMDYLTQVSNFGYGYLDHTTREYYMAAQELIWEAFTEYDVTWSYHYADIMDTINIEQYKQDILKSVEQFNKDPLLPESIHGYYGETLVFPDYNQSLHYYEINHKGKNQVWIEGNQLFIKVLSDEMEQIELIKKVNNEIADLYYAGSSYQRIVLFGKEDFNTYQVMVSPAKKRETKLQIQFENEEGFPLKNVISFQLYDVNKKVYLQNGAIYETDKSGKFLSSFTLPVGKYQIIPTINHNHVFSFELNDYDCEQSKYFISYRLQEEKYNLKLISKSKVLVNHNGIMIEQIQNNIGKKYCLKAAEIINDQYGNLKYKKGDLVNCITTDEKGIGVIENLWNGLYEWKENEKIYIKQKNNVIEDIESYSSISFLFESYMNGTYEIVGDMNWCKGSLFASGNLIKNQVEERKIFIPNGSYIFRVKETGEVIPFTITEENQSFHFTCKENDVPLIDEFVPSDHIILPLPNTSSKLTPKNSIIGIIFFLYLVICAKSKKHFF